MFTGDVVCLFCGLLLCFLDLVLGFWGFGVHVFGVPWASCPESRSVERLCSDCRLGLIERGIVDVLSLGSGEPTSSLGCRVTLLLLFHSFSVWFSRSVEARFRAEESRESDQ